MNTVARFAAVALIMITGFDVASVGAPRRLTAESHADDTPWPPWPFVGYHWCPGHPFNAAWGPQWEPTTCHDAHHRDLDGTIHTRDYFGPSPFQTWPEIPNTRP